MFCTILSLCQDPRKEHYRAQSICFIGEDPEAGRRKRLLWLSGAEPEFGDVGGMGRECTGSF